MLGSPRQSDSAHEGDLDPRGLAAVVLVSGLMVLAIGAGMLLTRSGDTDANPVRGVLDPSRTSMYHPPAAPAAVVPPQRDSVVPGNGLLPPSQAPAAGPAAPVNGPATPQIGSPELVYPRMAPANPPAAPANSPPVAVAPPVAPHPVDVPILLPPR
ncbi:hypothetical protein AB0L82_00225 [Nocardia sp. NPDC052001]|uniref:hypothetical protein n=1 Tax=Nocardia sp. NPDC052001 TaxID=3154853 RepID=UPI0034498008